MTTPSRVKARPKARVGDIAVVPGAVIFGMPFYRITGIELDATGEVAAYMLAALDSTKPGQPVAAFRVSAILTNLLTQES